MGTTDFIKMGAPIPLSLVPLPGNEPAAELPLSLSGGDGKTGLMGGMGIDGCGTTRVGPLGDGDVPSVDGLEVDGGSSDPDPSLGLITVIGLLEVLGLLWLGSRIGLVTSWTVETTSPVVCPSANG